MGENISKEIFKILDEAKEIASINPNRSLAMSRKVYNLAKQNNLKKEEGYALISMSLACRAKADITVWLDYSYSALKIFQDVEDILGKIKALNLIGIAYFYNSMFEQALSFFLQALDLIEENKEPFLLSSILNNVGEVFRESGKYDIALGYYDRAFKIATSTNKKIVIASLLNNIGEIYLLKHDYDEALESFINSYEIFLGEKDMIMLAQVEDNLGKVFYKNKNYISAEKYFNMSLKRLEYIDNKFYGIDVLMDIGIYEFDKNKNKAFNCFKKAIAYAEEIKAKKKLSIAYKTIAEFYERVSDFKEALIYFKKYHFIDQEISSFIVGKKLEILKIELDHLKEKHQFEEIKNANHMLEIEILNKKSELKKVQELNKSLEDKVFKDELACVPNRRYINYYLNKDLGEASKHDSSMILYIIDIDDFKKYNDTLGHTKGDECIIKIASALNNISIDNDSVFGRYGGEEFICYAKNITYDEALELGSKLRKCIEELGLAYISCGINNMVTISLGGVYGKISKFKDIIEMIEVADRELYKAKNMGKNTVLINNIFEK